MSRILTVVGARPQFIKAAAVSRVLRATPGMTETLVHTGQHYDAEMSDVFFDELSLPRPDHHLGVGSGSHGEQTGRMLEAIERTLIGTKPDWVLVYGDTNSTLAGALAAVKLHVPVAHVEAGLRSFNRSMPEEINRVVTDQCSDLLLAPTPTAEENLRKEGIAPARIRTVGDVMYDASVFYGEQARTRSRILETLSLKSQGYILATVHRAGNTNDRSKLNGILDGLRRAAARMPVVLPLHPRTVAVLKADGTLDAATKGLTLSAPVGYLDMVQLERNARAIATDSGGVQKEAFFYRVPCVTLREETEWVETVQRGANTLVGADAGKIDQALRAAIGRGRTEGPGSVYGDGDASRKIAALLQKGD